MRRLIGFKYYYSNEYQTRLLAKLTKQIIASTKVYSTVSDKKIRELNKIKSYFSLTKNLIIEDQKISSFDRDAVLVLKKFILNKTVGVFSESGNVSKKIFSSTFLHDISEVLTRIRAFKNLKLNKQSKLTKCITRKKEPKVFVDLKKYNHIHPVVRHTLSYNLIKDFHKNAFITSFFKNKISKFAVQNLVKVLPKYNPNAFLYKDCILNKKFNLPESFDFKQRPFKKKTVWYKKNLILNWDILSGFSWNFLFSQMSRSFVSSKMFKLIKKKSKKSTKLFYKNYFIKNRITRLNILLRLCSKGIFVGSSNNKLITKLFIGMRSLFLHNDKSWLIKMIKSFGHNKVV